MLVAALSMTGVGLLFLIIALYSGALIWAWLCIAICGVGFILLLIDIFRDRPGEKEESLIKVSTVSQSADNSYPAEQD